MNVLNNPKKYFWITLFQSSSFLYPVMTLFYLHRGLNFQNIFILYAFLTVSMFLFEVPTGIVGDKFGRKTSISLAFLGFLIFEIGLLFANSFTFFIILFILLGISITFMSGSDEALIYDSLKQVEKQKEMKKYMGKIISAKFLPLVFIAPIGSLIAKDLTSIQFNILILGGILMSLIAFLMTFTLVEPRSESGPHEIRSPLKLFKLSVKHIKESPKLVSMFMNKILIMIPGMHIFAILWQPYLKSSGIPVVVFGTLVAVSALFIFVLERNIGKIESKINGRKIIFYTGLFPLLAFLLGAYFSNIWMALIFYFIVKILIWLREPVFSEYINKHIESHNRATVLSSLSMIDSLFDVIIFLSAGLIANISVSYSFMFSAVLMFIALVFFRVTKSHIKIKG